MFALAPVSPVAAVAPKARVAKRTNAASASMMRVSACAASGSSTLPPSTGISPCAARDLPLGTLPSLWGSLPAHAGAACPARFGVVVLRRFLSAGRSSDPLCSRTPRGAISHPEVQLSGPEGARAAALSPPPFRRLVGSIALPESPAFLALARLRPVRRHHGIWKDTPLSPARAALRRLLATFSSQF